MTKSRYHRCKEQIPTGSLKLTCVNGFLIGHLEGGGEESIRIDEKEEVVISQRDRRGRSRLVGRDKRQRYRGAKSLAAITVARRCRTIKKKHQIAGCAAYSCR